MAPILGTSTIAALEEGAFSIEQVALGEAPFPLSTFEIFARGEYAGENVDFLKAVAEFKALYEKYNETDLLEDQVQEEIKKVFESIVENYIVSGSSSEVNISSVNREGILDLYHSWNKEAVTNSKDVFSNGNQEILGLLASDTYPRFLKLLRSRNLSDGLAKEASKLGWSIFLFGMGIHAVFCFINYVAIIQPLSSNGWELMTNRLWRILGFPFVNQGLGFIAAGRTRLCSICSGAQVNHVFDERTVTYSQIALYETMVKWNCQVDKAEHDQYRTTVDSIATANAKRSAKQDMIVLVLSIITTVAVLFIPPNEPKWY